MADADSHHKRSKSTAALSILRRGARGGDDESGSDDGHDGRSSVAGSHSQSHSPTKTMTTANQYPPSSSSSRPGPGHVSALSTPNAILTRTASNPAGLRQLPALEKPLSLEQSVRKFRIVEALRSGDTATISKAIREAAASASAAAADRAGSRLSTSSALAATIAPSGGGCGGGVVDGTTILHLAMQCAEFPVLEYVLSDGLGSLDVNARDRDGNTPLHVAAIHGRTQAVKLLLEQKEINDAIANNHGKLPIDLARNPEIFQLLQLSRSLFTDAKVRQVQELIAANDYETLAHVLEEQRLKTVLDINSPEFVSDPVVAQAGGTLLHEAARRKNLQLIQVLLLHGADPFRRDRKGKLPQSITSDDNVKAILKKSPAAVAAQRGIQEKAVLGHAASQGAVAGGASPDPLAGREAREIKGYLKKWTNYRKGYQLRWFVLEDGVLSYYKHQDDAGSACRGAINMKIAQLYMSPDEKTKFEIIGKSSVKYTLKANHEVEAKRWFWALNNSIQWTKDQAKEEERVAARNAELLRQAKADQQQQPQGHPHPHHQQHQLIQDHHPPHSESSTSVLEMRRSSAPALVRSPSSKQGGPSQNRSEAAGSYGGGGLGGGVGGGGGGTSTVGSAIDDEMVDALTEAASREHDTAHGMSLHDDHEDDDDGYYADENSGREEPRATKDALNITAQSAKLQLEAMASVHQALGREAAHSPGTSLSDPKVVSALAAYDAAIQGLTGLIGDLLRISKDRDAFWQYRLDRETNMRRMWEESMAKVALEQEALEARVGESEMKRKLAKKALKEVMEGGLAGAAAAADADAVSPRGMMVPGTGTTELPPIPPLGGGDVASPRARASTSTSRSMLLRKASALEQMAEMSDSEAAEEDDEFFDAVDAGEVEVAELPPDESAQERKSLDAGLGTRLDISSSFRGYENGIRTRLKMESDDRPKISLWGILKSMIGKDMTRMTLPVSFNEPTSLLYRCGEDMEYADLLDLASERADSLERLIYVAAFAASEYASTIGRVAKPFNPLLGETFEYVRPDKNYRFFIEQVSHHPPVGAAWAEAPNWTYWGESNVKSKFYGKSFDINPLGTWFLKLRPVGGGAEDLYTWKKVTSSVIGIITGSPTVDNYGTMEIKNWTTGEVALVEFKPRGWKASSAYQIAGKVMDASGTVRVSLGGRWNSRLYARLTPGYEATVDEPSSTARGDGAPVHRGSLVDPTRAYLIWEANERPAGIPFNLTPFVLSFNHVDEVLRPWLAPTDSRLRPDQRAMEDGEYDFAATEKNRLEEAQRARRRAREAAGEEFVPAWFERARCDVTGEEYWRFSGRYWEQRAKAGAGDGTAWDGLEPIFGDLN